jgi:hypothetical protein
VVREITEADYQNITNTMCGMTWLLPKKWKETIIRTTEPGRQNAPKMLVLLDNKNIAQIM